MSKTKLAWLVFCIAFGVNLLAFVFSKKTFTVEENKNLWIYELPLSASPLDSYVAEELGPHNGVVGTLGRLEDHHEFQNKTLTIFLKEGLRYSNGDAILPEHWAASMVFLHFATTELGFSGGPEWSAYKNATTEWKSPTEVQFQWKELPPGFDAEVFVKKVLTHPLTGVIHPQNLADLKAGKKITKDWISSGPYKVRKWNPKEIVLVSRDNFPVMLPKEFFRTLKYQSAPIKNPSCDFIQALQGEGKDLEDHKAIPVPQSLHVFWLCRSWKEKGSFCENASNRENFAKVFSGTEAKSAPTLAGQKIRYRIPLGSDAFRNEIREKIVSLGKNSGATTEEISYLFKASEEADIELLMVVTDSKISSENAAKLAIFSSRLGVPQGETPQNLVGEVFTQPIEILMKHMKGDPYSKTFLEPDLEEKKMPL